MPMTGCAIMFFGGERHFRLAKWERAKYTRPRIACVEPVTINATYASSVIAKRWLMTGYASGVTPLCIRKNKEPTMAQTVWSYATVDDNGKPYRRTIFFYAGSLVYTGGWMGLTDCVWIVPGTIE
jgi:hypothetical protein